MVMIDGHHAFWQSQFRVSVLDTNTNRMSFMHLDLSRVDWEFFNKHKKMWYLVEVLDCQRIESGLPFLFPLTERMYISFHYHDNAPIVFNLEMGRVLGAGLLAPMSRLQQLHCSSCTWTVPGMMGLMQGLELTKTLNKLNLSYTHFDSDGDETIELLVQGLKQNGTISCLRLNKCRLTDTQIATLLQKPLSVLKELYLGGNVVGQNSIKALNDWFQQHNSLCSLVTLGLSHSLRNNESTNAVAQESNLDPLWQVLAHSPRSLTNLHLASNRLNDDDIVPLMAAVACSNNITFLDLKSNLLIDSSRLAHHLPPQLHTLWLLGNPLKESSQALLHTIQKRAVEMMDCRIPTYSLFAPVPLLQQIQKQIHYYQVLNRGGRRILVNSKRIPLSLWTLILARVNRLEFGRNYEKQRGRLDAMYYLLRNGPVILER